MITNLIDSYENSSATKTVTFDEDKNFSSESEEDSNSGSSDENEYEPPISDYAVKYEILIAIDSIEKNFCVL